MNKEQEIIKLLLEKVEELQWLEGTAKTDRTIFYTNLGNSKVTIDSYSGEVYIDSEYIGISVELECRILKILTEAKDDRRNKTLDPVLNMLKGNLR
jgi:hypothetical protein